VDGVGYFVERGTGQAEFSIDGPKTFCDVTGGVVKQKDSRLDGSRAQDVLRARQQRISAVCAWMKSFGAPTYDGQKQFESYWQPVLSGEALPEELAVLRDGGVLQADWEEASAWFYIEYNLENIVEQLVKTYFLSETKKN
jgi:hypothetical protein